MMSMVEPKKNCDRINGVGGSGEDELMTILNSFWDFPMESLEGGGSDTSMYCLTGLPLACLEEQKEASNNATPIHIKPEQKELRDNVEDNTATNTIDQIFPVSSAFQTPRQNSVSERNNFCSSATTSSIRAKRSRRPRSKRLRKPTINLLHLVSSLYYSYLLQKGLQAGKNKESGNTGLYWLSNVPNNSEYDYEQVNVKMPKQLNDGIEKIKPSLHRSDAIRKCMHCLVIETPQWREGPWGPRTLCNACGVRYRTGRLFPEYRPAASPTFVPALHSNLHKKVVAMREKRKKPKLHRDADKEPPMSPPSPDFVPMPNYLFDFGERLI